MGSPNRPLSMAALLISCLSVTLHPPITFSVMHLPQLPFSNSVTALSISWSDSETQTSAS